MHEIAHAKKGRVTRLGCACVLLVPIAISVFTVVAAHLKQARARPQGLGVSAARLAGDYVVQDTQGFNNRGGFTKMPLDEIDRSSVVTVQQGADWLEFAYSDWKNRKRTDRITRIGSPGSKWTWITNGVAGCGLPVRIINLYMLPGLVFYDQRGALTQTQTGLTLEYTWAEGGALFWMIPWGDSQQRTQIILTKTESDKRDRTTPSTRTQ